MEEITKPVPGLQYEPVDIAGRAVVITGGTTGIGRAAALMLAAHGAKVLICGRHEQELNDALNDIRDVSQEAHGLTADMSSIDDIRRVFSEADERFGGVDILINNAALAAGGALDKDYADWEYIVRTNLLGYISCVQEGARRMEKRGRGHIVNIGSMSADTREPGSSVYVATKAGIQGFSEALRKELNSKGIKVTLIEPGLVGTDMTVEKVPVPEQPAEQEKMKMLKAEDIAACIYYSLTQPERCDVVHVQIRPHMQEI